MPSGNVRTLTAVKDGKERSWTATATSRAADGTIGLRSNADSSRGLSAPRKESGLFRSAGNDSRRAAVKRRRSNERCGQSLKIMVCNANKEDQAGASMSAKASLKLDTAGRITSRNRFHLLKADQQERARLQAGLSFSD